MVSTTAMTKVAAFLLGMQAQLRLYHWRTGSYARHRATDELVGRIVDVSDRLVEAMSGRLGGERPRAAPIADPVDLDDDGADKYLETCVHFLTHVLPALLGRDTALLSIRDEALEALHRARYLFGLR